jgi:hypothetical protein
VRKPRWLPGALALLAIAALPLVADRLRSRSELCAMDGSAVKSCFRVRIVERSGTVRSFCGVRCADRWLARAGAVPRAVLVTDCGNGREVEAEAAWFLYTITGWGEEIPDFVRVFARRSDAERHASAHGGEILMGAERPFLLAKREQHERRRR